MSSNTTVESVLPFYFVTWKFSPTAIFSLASCFRLRNLIDTDSEFVLNHFLINIWKSCAYLLLYYNKNEVFIPVMLSFSGKTWKEAGIYQECFVWSRPSTKPILWRCEQQRGSTEPSWWTSFFWKERHWSFLKTCRSQMCQKYPWNCIIWIEQWRGKWYVHRTSR